MSELRKSPIVLTEEELALIRRLTTELFRNRWSSAFPEAKEDAEQKNRQQKQQQEQLEQQVVTAIGVNPTPLQYSGHATPRSQAAPSPELSTSLGRLRDGCLEGSPAASKGAGDRSHSTDPAVAGTVLYRNSTPGGSFTGSLHLRLAAALAKKPGVTAVRVQHRRKIVGADAGTPACLSELLTIKELSGFPLTARESADRRSSVGFLHGVDGDLTDLELTTGRASTVLILAASNGGQTVRLRFASSQPPNQVTFCGLLLRPAEDSRDAFIAFLLAALRVVGDALPPKHLLRAVCLAAHSGEPGTTLLT
ncbi:hypothetical protein MRX96_016068 [Rhipicephalus microplus]